MKKALLTIGLGIISLLSYAQLNGTYTIDGSSPTSGSNFQTWSAAVSALGTSGVSGPVTFNVAQGTFSETVNFPTSIGGSSSTNTITFQSDASNTSNPVVTSSSYVIRMYYANLHDITFRSIDFVGTSTYCIYMYAYGSSAYTYQNINFEDCLIQVPTYSAGQYPIYLYGYFGGVMDLNFDNCVIRGGYYSVYGYLYYGASGSHLTFNDSEFDGFYYMSAYLYSYQAYPKITFTNNYVHDAGNNSSVYGLYCYYSGAGTEISGNRFELTPTNYGYGVLAYYANGTSTDPVKVHNNIITYPSNPQYSQYGLRMGYGYYNKIYHNTTNITNNYGSSYGAYMYYTYFGAGNEYKNNIVRTEGTSPYTMYCYNGNSSYLDMSDNVYYCTSATSVRLYAATAGQYNTLGAWQTATSNDAGSVVADPDWSSAYNLIPQNVDVDDICEPVGITEDIDGFARSSVEPDPGAHEFSVPTNNAGMDELISPNAPLCADDTSVIAVLSNTGLVPLTSCTISYELNGTVQTNFVFSGSLAVGSDTTLTIVSSTSFSSGDEIRVWSSMPNGVQDSSAAFDTVSVQIFTGLTGTFNIPSDYPTLTAAAADVMLSGLCGNVVMEISPGTYSEQLYLGEILGSGPNGTLTWKSTTGNNNDVVIEFNTSGSVVDLSGSDYVSFLDVTIRNTTSSYGTGVSLSNVATNDLFDNCIIETGSLGTTSSSLCAFRSSGNNDNLTIRNSEILRGGYGLWISGNGNTSQQQNVVIENNLIKNAYYMQTITEYVDGFEFNNNVVTNDTNMYLLAYGLRMYYVDNYNVVGNYIGADATYNGSSQYGGYSYPFYLYYSIGTNNPRSQVSNNCITAGRPGSSYYGYYGLYAYQSGVFDFHNNSVAKVGGYTGYYGAYFSNGGLVDLKNNSFINYLSGQALYADGFTVADADHNNFVSTGGTLITHANNNYSTVEEYQNGSGFGMHSISTDPAYQDTLECVTCNDTLDNAGTPTQMYDIDSNMRSVVTPDIGPVEWVSPANFTLGGDSTYCADEVLIEAGPAQNVTWSVNGNSSNAPSLTLTGGTQATTYNVLVSIETEYCGSASDNALITLVPNANLDSNVHICADDDATLNPGGIASGSYTWSTGAMTQSITVDAPGSYTVTKDVMGCVSTATTAVTQSEAVEIVGTEVCSDDLPLSLDATIANGTTYAWSGGTAPTSAVNTFNDGGAYTVTATDALGCSSIDSFEVVVLEEPQATITTPSYSAFIYVFDASTSPFLTASSTVNWSFGAGASPATSTNVMQTVVYPWSNPSNPATYSVSLEINNGCGVDIATQIIQPSLGVEDLKAGEFAIFPNPANDVVTVATKDVDAGNILILDMSGRTVAQSPMSAGSNNHEINVNGLAAGSYIVKVVTDANTQMKQLIVQ